MRHERLLLFLVGLVLVAAPIRAQIVINEIMYDSPGFPDVEYIEIYNAGPVAQNIDGWYVLDDNDTHDRCFLVGTLAPGAYLVIAGDLDLFATKYPGVTNTNPNQFESDVEGQGFVLGDGGDQVRLYSPTNIQIDIVWYNDTSPWPTEPDGDGPSLELYHPSLDNNLPSSWAASTNGPPEGTPGTQNSVFTTDQPPIVEAVARDLPLPESSDTVTVTATVTDGQALDHVDLMVDTGSGFVAQLMFDDGLHGDGAAADSVFGTQITPRATGTLVRYYVLATDAIAQTSTWPIGAPADYLAYTVDHKPPALRINEIVAVNMTGIVDEMGVTEDWLEIHNTSPEPVNLDGMYLSNNFLQSAEWRMPNAVLPPGGFVLIWCDDDDMEGPFHTDFKLSKAGSEVALFETIDHGNVMIHGFEYGVQSADISFGYFPDDSDAPEYLVNPTPAASNNTSTLFSPICINEFMTTSASGGIDDWVELYNRGSTLVNIGGWHLSDEADEPLKYQFPPNTQIGPGNYISIDEDTFEFGFSSTGREVVSLTSANATVGQDYFDYGPQTDDVSQGRMPNGSANWHFFVATSRGFQNSCIGVPALGSTSNLRFSSSTTMVWDASQDAAAYDTVVGDLDALKASAGDFAAALTGCLLNNGEAPLSWDASLPASGGALFYLVRPVDFECGFGTYNTGAGSQHADRDPGIGAATVDCP